MAGEAVGSGVEVQGHGKNSLISGQVGDEALQVESEAGIQDGGEGEGEGDEAFEDVAKDVRDGNGSASMRTSTYTVGSSLADEVVEENGRTYHVFKDGKYMLPNDEIELNRLDMQHKMWSITLDGKLHLAPIGPNPQNVLDIGTGTGIWAIEFANTYPSARVIGTDLSVIQPAQPEVIPSNLSFEIDDAEDEWILPQKFDYIHGRTLATCFKDPPSIIGKAFDALAPGGYFELQDMCLQTSDDGSMNGTALLEWQTHVKEAATKTGVEWTNVPNYKRWMIEKGFEGVTEVSFRWPSNQWSRVRKERLLGAWTQAQIDNGMLESVSTRLFMMKLGWEKERLDEFLARVRRDTKDPRIKAYSPITVVYGRKPLSA